MKCDQNGLGLARAGVGRVGLGKGGTQDNQEQSWGHSMGSERPQTSSGGRQREVQGAACRAGAELIPGREAVRIAQCFSTASQVCTARHSPAMLEARKPKMCCTHYNLFSSIKLV